MEINIVVGHVDKISNDTDSDVCEGIEADICLSSDQTSLTTSNNRKQKYRDEWELKP